MAWRSLRRGNLSVRLGGADARDADWTVTCIPQPDFRDARTLQICGLQLQRPTALTNRYGQRTWGGTEA